MTIKKTKIDENDYKKLKNDDWKHLKWYKN